MNVLPALFIIAHLGIAFSASVYREKRIVGGKTLLRGEWPFLVSLHYMKPFAFTRRTHMRHLCGGALVHPRWVITAGHCIGFIPGMDDVNAWNVVLGEYNQYLKDLGEQVIKPQQFFIHPDFRPQETSTLQNDIALIKLTDEVTMNTFVGTVPVSNGTQTADNTKCVIGGWGQVSSDPYGWGMFIPLKASVFVINNTSCQQTYSDLVYKETDYRMVVDETVVCAGMPNEYQTEYLTTNHVNPDACNGDSGSPLVCPTGPGGILEVVGVVSAGKGCGTGEYPGIYTKVSRYHEWIMSTIENN